MHLSDLSYCLRSKKAKGKRWGPSTNITTSVQSCKVCSHCLTRIYCSSNHSSHSDPYYQRERVKDITKLVNSPTSREKLVLRATETSTDSTLSTLSGKRKNVQKPTEVKKALFKKEDIILISENLWLRSTTTKILSRYIRVFTGNRSQLLSQTLAMRWMR